MTLLTCVFAAIICSILWYKHAPDNTMRLGTLSLMYSHRVIMAEF